MVVELNDGCIRFRSLKNFTEQQQLGRRTYGGYDIPAVETVTLAKEALGQPRSWSPYSLLTNNCEHFATLMKVKIQWSGQVCASAYSTYIRQVK